MDNIDSQKLLDSFPHPAMIIREDRKVLAANIIAKNLGAVIGVFCWEGFANAKNLSDEHYEKYRENPDTPGIQCFFCRADNCLTNQSKENDPLLQSHVGIFDTYWVPISRNTYLHYAIDITERKQATEALRKNQEMLDQTQQIARIGSWQLDISSNHLAWSDETYRIFGIEPQAFVATYEAFLDSVHPDDRPAVDAAYSESLREGEEAYEIEHRIIRKDSGEIRHVYEKCRHERDSSGAVIRSTGMVQDTTERKQFEKEKIKSQQLLEQMGAISNVGGWLYDIDTEALEWTGEVYKIHEVDSGFILNVKDAINFYSDASKPIIAEAVQKLIEDGEPYDLELEIITAKGNLRHVHSKGVADHENRRIYGAIQDITLKKSAELALQDSYTRFEHIATNIGDWIWEIDLEGRYTYASGRIEDILGYNVVDVIGESVVSLMTKESAKAAKSFFRKLLREKRPFNDFENWCYHKSGRLVCLSSNGNPVFDSDGKLVGYRGVDKDITIDKHEEVLRSSRIELAEDKELHGINGMLRKILDKAETITDSKISFFQYVKDDQESLHLQPWSDNTLGKFCKTKGFDRHYPASSAGVWTDCVLEKKSVIHNDYESLTNKKGLPEGHAHVVRELVVPIVLGGKVKAILGVGNKPYDYDEWDSKALERFSVHCWEILERKMAAEKVRETNEILQETQEIGKIGTWTYDFIENIVSWSLENYRIFGVSENTVPTFELFVERVHPDDRATVLAHFEEAKKNGIFDIEYRLMLDGLVKCVHGKANFEYEKGKPVRIMGFTQDITEKRNYQQAQLRSGQLSALGEVAAGVAHEINNPINGVINYAQLLINRNLEKDQANQILERIIREGNRISTIVKNLLNFATKDRSEFSFLDIAGIVTEPLNLQTQLLKKDGINVELRVPRGLPKIYGNRMQLEQVILNLLSNARHALHKKYPQPCNEKCIVIEAAPSHDKNGGCVQLSIKDFGCGIPKDHLEKIFNPFFTTKEAGVGTGLGMSISHDILEKHGAAISIDSQVNKYTTIKITFPAKSQETSN